MRGIFRPWKGRHNLADSIVINQWPELQHGLVLYTTTDLIRDRVDVQMVCVVLTYSAFETFSCRLFLAV